MSDEEYTSIDSSSDSLEHVGKPHAGATSHSGRYKWGSGDKWEGKDPTTSRNDILGAVAKLREEGVTNGTEIAKALGMTTPEYRARYSVAFNEVKNANIHKANALKNQGWSTTAIGKEMGVNESTVRGWLKPGMEARKDIAMKIADHLESTIPKNGAVDIGKNTELYFGTSADKLKVAAQILQDKGYTVNYMYVNQLGTAPGMKTTVKLLCAPGVSLKGDDGLYNHRDRVVTVAKKMSDAKPKESLAVKPPISIDSKRVGIVYADKEWAGAKGIDRDGVMMINPNAVDLRLPPNVHYAQVRIGVDGTHYLKGMAVYGDPTKFPKGVDVMFSTNKKSTVDKMDVLKSMEIDKITGKVDPNNPFKAAIGPQTFYTDPKTGERKQSPINVVNAEGDWNNWSKSLASQMLSKQDPQLASRQLGIALDRNRLEYDTIKHLNNPVVKKRLLQDFADQCDSGAESLKAAAMPGQKTHVILPVPSLKPTEVFAPNYAPGTPVVLIRYPHGGRFEIPELKVNNRNKEALSMIGANALDAIGINAKVAERLSGADFDGDTVLVIPNRHGEVKTLKPLAGLKNFDPSADYALPKGIEKATPRDPRLIKAKTKQTEMGKVSNLITDMTIKGASLQDLEAAVKHSMVVIDSEKHKLDYKQSYKDNNIDALKRKYQGVNSKGQPNGASTLISRASSEIRVNERKLRPAREGGPIDPATGKKVYVDTGRTYFKPVFNKNGDLVRYKEVPRQSTPSRMALTDDARSLSSGTRIENIYANYANHMKALGNTARKEYLATEDFKIDPVAKKKYEPQVNKMVAQLNEAKMNAPLERKAQIIANVKLSQIKDSHPEYDKEDLKQIGNRELKKARSQMGIEGHRVDITDDDWAAIQAHAVSANRLSEILQYADADRVKQLATPIDRQKLPAWSTSKAKSLIAQGLTNEEVASALGVSVSTLTRSLEG